MLILMKNSLNDFRNTYQKYLSFEFIYMLMTSIVFIPILSFVFNRVLRALGSYSLLNGEVFKIGLSYSGLIGMILICFLFVIILFIEFGVIICISQKKYFGKDILLTEAFMTTIKKIPNLFSFGILQLMLFLFLLVPFIDSPLTSIIMEKINIPIFVTNRIYGSHILLVIYGLLLISFLYLILRWIFTLHFIIIDGKSMRDAIRCSLIFTKNKKIRILLYLLLFNLLIFLVGFVFITALAYIPSLVGTNMFSFLINHYLVSFTNFMTAVFAILLTPINTIFLTRLYYNFKNELGLELKDELLMTPKNTGLYQVEKKSFSYFRNRKYLLVIVLFLYMTAIFFVNNAIKDNIVYLRWNVEIAGHRGDMYRAPENSLSSIRSAIEKEVDAVEIDVQMTKDGIMVLNHDVTLRRVAGVSKRTLDLNYWDISKLEIGSHFSEDFRGEKIPTLEEVLVEMKDTNIKLIIEIKNGPYKVMAEKVVSLIEEHEMEDSCYIQSFSYTALQEVRKLNPNIKIGQIFYISVGNLSSLDLDFYTISQNILSEKLVRNAHRDEREVWVYTVNNERIIKEVLKYDIDGIITDYPEKVSKVIGVGM